MTTSHTPAVLVTGGARGIGAATVRAFHDDGAAVIGDVLDEEIGEDHPPSQAAALEVRVQRLETALAELSAAVERLASRAGAVAAPASEADAEATDHPPRPRPKEQEQCWYTR
ncbi:hypothetical protein GCM10027570_20530 [Streptomonospora sediminis]